jgi:hypothetical protein
LWSEPRETLSEFREPTRVDAERFEIHTTFVDASGRQCGETWVGFHNPNYRADYFIDSARMADLFRVVMQCALRQ